ncbi:EAL domain-containing protein [Catenovulum sp. SM1970]|uniref:bifunctional diguanylate cyclase/phosphodiesterase n=1 Tax=Marinifaba aquimaris TaxID=2741323 RepID=UPI001572DD2E|nr:EAL domain-containing protein [Marinifaba aquimaris]NTS77503.1 EAL domain-containing protein [Marinifaba aquimaris]
MSTLINSAFIKTYRIVILTAVLGVLLSFSAFNIIQFYEQQKVTSQFESSFKQKVTTLEQAILAIDKVILATHHFISVNPDLDRSAFSSLIDKDFLSKTGLRGIQWAPKTTTDQIKQLEQQMRASGIFDYRTYPSAINSSNCKSQWQYSFPVKYAEPLDAIGEALGFQLTSDCKIASALENAANEQTITSYTFVNDDDEVGVKLFYPLIIDGELLGFIVGVVMLNELIDTLIGDVTVSDEYQMTIHNDKEKGNLLYQSQWQNTCDECENQAPLMQLQANISFANQLWYVTFSKQGLNQHADLYASAAAGSLLVLTLILCGYIRTNINRMTWANKLVKQKTESLSYQASHDQLTRLKNRSALSECLQTCLPGNTQQPFSPFTVLFIDLDHFKRVNDTKGHLIGDLLLQQVAERLTEFSRSKDQAFRFGGDEFIVLLKDITDDKTVTKIAQRYLNEIKKPYYIENNYYHIGVSIGVSIIEQANTSLDTVLRDADIAMYEAKKQGRGQVIFFDDSMYKNLVREHSLEMALQTAVEKNQLRLAYQPIVNTKQQVIGFEALVRWQHPSKGLIMPDQFIGLAEKNDMICHIGDWVIKQAIAQLAQWQTSIGPDKCPYISVNLSPLQLQKPEVASYVANMLTHYNVPGRRLAVELTESTLAENKKVVSDNITMLQAHGVKLFMDDFGTGYSSISLLQHYPIDVIKIDRSFVFNLQKHNVSDHRLVQAIISMAKVMNLQVVAEGVENQALQSVLVDMGIDFLQGYHYAKPLMQDEFTAYVQKHIGFKNLTRQAASNESTPANRYIQPIDAVMEP